MPKALTNINRRALYGFFLFVILTSVIQAFRNRSFWLDEAMIFSTLQTRSVHAILFSGSLDYGQQFPRVYLAFIAMIIHAAGADYTFWARFLPLVFGLAGFSAWILLFYEHFWIKQKQLIPWIVASGLLAANAYAIYYCFELKPYSADFCFSGILCMLAQSKILSDRRQHLSLLCTAVVSLMFSYTSIFVIGAIIVTTFCDQQQRQNWRKDWKFIAIFLTVGTIEICLLYQFDYRFGEPPGHGGVLHDYWKAFFVQGNSWMERMSSLKNLFEVFITDWWKTDSGPINESMTQHAWYVLPFRTFGNPDIRNLVRVISFGLLLYSSADFFFRKNQKSENKLFLSAVVIGVLAFSALCHIYPWGISRLTLFAMPFSAILIVESVIFLTKCVRYFFDLGKLFNLLWIPMIWLIIRNGLFLIMACAFAPLPQNIRETFKYLSPKISPILLVSGANDVIVKAASGIPLGMTVLYENEISQQQFDKEVKGGPFYFLWAHYRPQLNQDGVPLQYAANYNAAPVFVRPPALGLGLLMLSPKPRAQ